MQLNLAVSQRCEKPQSTRTERNCHGRYVQYEIGKHGCGNKVQHYAARSERKPNASNLFATECY
jgi:hypothetical protein